MSVYDKFQGGSFSDKFQHYRRVLDDKHLTGRFKLAGEVPRGLEKKIFKEGFLLDYKKFKAQPLKPKRYSVHELQGCLEILKKANNDFNSKVEAEEESNESTSSIDSKDMSLASLRTSSLVKRMKNKLEQQKHVPRLEGFTRKDSKRVEDILENAHQYSNKNEFQKALSEYEKAFKLTKSWKHYFLLPILYIKMKNPNKAVQAYLNLAEYQIKSGDVFEAIESLEKAKSVQSVYVQQGSMSRKLDEVLVKLYLLKKDRKNALEMAKKPFEAVKKDSQLSTLLEKPEKKTQVIQQASLETKKELAVENNRLELQIEKAFQILFQSTEDKNYCQTVIRYCKHFGKPEQLLNWSAIYLSILIEDKNWDKAKEVLKNCLPLEMSQRQTDACFEVLHEIDFSKKIGRDPDVLNLYYPLSLLVQDRKEKKQILIRGAIEALKQKANSLADILLNDAKELLDDSVEDYLHFFDLSSKLDKSPNLKEILQKLANFFRQKGLESRLVKVNEKLFELTQDKKYCGEVYESY